jgi:hypothetical protein
MFFFLIRAAASNLCAPSQQIGTDSNLPGIPLQKGFTLRRVLNHFPSFKDLKETLTVSHRSEYLHLYTKPCLVSTVEDSVLCTEMENLESQEEDT